MLWFWSVGTFVISLLHLEGNPNVSHGRRRGELQLAHPVWINWIKGRHQGSLGPELRGYQGAFISSSVERVTESIQISHNDVCGTLHHNLPRIPDSLALFPQILNGYFVHYFAPTDLPPLPKNVVFVLDSSASMVGTKLKQVSSSCVLWAAQLWGCKVWFRLCLTMFILQNVCCVWGERWLWRHLKVRWFICIEKWLC